MFFNVFDDLGGPKTPKTLISYRLYNVFGHSLKSSIIRFSLKIRVRSKATDLHTVSLLSADPAGNISVSVRFYNDCICATLIPSPYRHPHGLDGSYALFSTHISYISAGSEENFLYICRKYILKRYPRNFKNINDIS